MDNSSHFTKEWEDLEFSDSNILTVLLEKCGELSIYTFLNQFTS